MSWHRLPRHAKLLRLLLALFVVCFVTVLIGFPTCDTERGTCPAWHQWMNSIAFYGSAVFLLASAILLLMVVSDASLRNKP
jgi:hypothetical protein